MANEACARAHGGGRFLKRSNLDDVSSRGADFCELNGRADLRCWMVAWSTFGWLDHACYGFAHSLRMGRSAGKWQPDSPVRRGGAHRAAGAAMSGRLSGAERFAAGCDVAGGAWLSGQVLLSSERACGWPSPRAPVACFAGDGI